MNRDTVEIYTSYGSFEVDYCCYTPASKGSQYEPPESSSVDIVAVRMIDDPQEYEYSIEELMSNSNFLREAEQSVIEYIEECYQAEEDAARIARWETDVYYRDEEYY